MINSKQKIMIFIMVVLFLIIGGLYLTVNKMVQTAKKIEKFEPLICHRHDGGSVYVEQYLIINHRHFPVIKNNYDGSVYTTEECE